MHYANLEVGCFLVLYFFLLDEVTDYLTPTMLIYMKPIKGRNINLYRSRIKMYHPNRHTYIPISIAIYIDNNKLTDKTVT